MPINFTDADDFLKALAREIDEGEHLREKLRVVVTSGGDPSPYVEMFKNRGLLYFHVVPSAYHARKVERLGADAVIAMGHEAGGHVSKDGAHTFVLVQAAVEAVKLPVIAAGGIAGGRGLVAALALGASGVQMGTRFMMSAEGKYPQPCKDLVLRATERDSVVTQGYIGPARYARNQATATLQSLVAEKRPYEEIAAFKDRSQELAYRHGDAERGLMPMGEVGGVMHEVLPAGEIVRRTVQEAEEVIAQLASLAPVGSLPT